MVGRAPVHHVAEAPDGTKKLLLRLADDRVVETVGIPSFYAATPRLTVCVSSQVRSRPGPGLSGDGQREVVMNWCS